MPEWCSGGLEIRVGESVCNGGIREGWLIIDREWKNGDVVTINLPLKISLHSVENGARYPAAFSYGPVVLAAVREEKPIVSKQDLEMLTTTLTKTLEDGLLKFKGSLDNKDEIELVPFYSIPEGKKYFMFFDPENNRIESDHLEYGPYENCWEKQEWGYISTGYKANFRVKFYGTGVRWIGKQLENGGKASIYIDGKYVDTVDQYGPFSGVPWMWEKTGLENAEHDMRVEVENEKNIDSKFRTITNGCVINVCHISVLH